MPKLLLCAPQTRSVSSKCILCILVKKLISLIQNLIYNYTKDIAYKQKLKEIRLYVNLKQTF